ncbi:BppU family phage baseplate upper protein [Lacticaseibacillus paracasei]|uniref:BppU family phage baseplate upper protein n=1 Tax=Lacticaseibacillus paracasei TaxID=1597 RepID=UPI00019C9329|nr:BppU family phage baseplate upper protein [Lacticaseibacillus paracasei]EEI68262.1 hypothetical protein HMPREF0530_1470 [Lacticaseibacillus paracasei subsp. paracasei ATCC 25302 = DSM 5622 = JCM 8130]KRM64105.1 minor tail protein [Lacticaseibacillus paracasei subsp. paracasei ATCC 25302 = DSM 5622 = JCM 8130]TDG90662.1 hypothetical protein C5L26_001622 [Lacticaseibacillus paracasei subsp. paracasei]BAN72164.1 phage minor tail protein [Lacticaseibacillus paracasei subsp. paracasei]GEL31578.1
MAIRTYDILLDSYNSTIPEPIIGRQGDKNGAVTLHVTITDRGTAVDLTHQTVNLIAETANGTAVVSDNAGVTLTEPTNGKFDYAIPNALWSEAGKITKAYFSLNDTDGQQATYDLTFIVKESIDISQDKADDYITIIDGTVRDLKTKVDAIYEYFSDGNFYNKNLIKIINQSLDKSNAVENAYWYFSGNVGQPVGQTTNATGMWAYNKVHVHKGETWSILQARLFFSGFTDIQGNKLSQFSTTDITGDIEYTADQDGYICVSAQSTTPKVFNLPLADITNDMRTFPAGVFGIWITGKHLLADNHKKITVSTAPELLKAINDLSNDTNYSDATIYLQEGVYDLYTAMGGASYITSVDAAASGELFGLNLPDRVSLIGNPHATITFEVPDNVATKTSSTRISVISILHTHTLENLDIIGKNVRYAVHDETGNGVSGLTRVVKNCHIEHLGNASGLWSATQAYAIGTGSGGSYDFENTVFKSVSSVWSAHDNANQKDNTFTFNQCKFVTGSDYSIRFGTYGSGDDMNYVTINNCDIDKYIYVMEEVPDSKTGMRFELKGGGNTKVPYWSVNSAGARLPIEFCDETARITNIGKDIIKDGTPIKLTDIGKGIAMGPTDAVYMAYGIALEDIAPGEQGVVKYAGYLSRDDTPLSSLTVGSRIGIIDGKLAQTNDDHYIGVVTQWRNILLRF